MRIDDYRILVACSDLMVALQRLWQRVVNDEAHIWLVDAHAKGNGGGNDLHLVSGPVLLHFLSVIWCQAGMVVPAQLDMLKQAAHCLYEYCYNCTKARA